MKGYIIYILLAGEWVRDGGVKAKSRRDAIKQAGLHLRPNKSWKVRAE